MAILWGRNNLYVRCALPRLSVLSRCALLRLHIISRQGEDDVKHLLVIPFVIGIVGIRHGGKESLELSSDAGYTRKQKEDASQHPLSLLTHRHLHFIKR